MTPREYLTAVLAGADRFAGAILFGEDKVTISALCAVVRSASKSPEHKEKIAQLKPIQRFQFRVLLKLGDLLESWSPGHLKRARENAIKSANTVITGFDQFIL